MNDIDLLLRNPSEIARRSSAGESLHSLVMTSLGIIVLGGAVFGAVVGSFRGGEQIAYASIKLPFALVMVMVITVPAFHAIGAALGQRWTFQTVVALSLASLGRGALVLFAVAPMLYLAIDLGLQYHSTALVAVLAFGLAGVAALGVLLRGIELPRCRIAGALAMAFVFLAVSGQTSWVLRPWLLRPRAESVPFLREREGGFVESIVTSARSAVIHRGTDEQRGRGLE